MLLKSLEDAVHQMNNGGQIQRTVGVVPAPDRAVQQVAPPPEPAPPPFILPPEPVAPPTIRGLDRLNLTSVLMGRDSAQEQSRLGGTWLHVSALAEGCARQSILSHRHLSDDRPMEDITYFRITFALGRAVEKHIRDQLILGPNREGPALGVYGDWTCGARHLPATRRLMRPGGDWTTCDRCGSRQRMYNEITMRDDEHRMVGRPDLVLCPDPYDVMEPLEIKSMTKTRWEPLSRPVGDHLLQVLMYRWMMQQIGFTVSNNVRLVYTVKEYLRRCPYKEFVVDATSSLAETMVEGALEVAREFARCFPDENALPPRTACGSPACTKARHCPVATLCFNLPEAGS